MNYGDDGLGNNSLLMEGGFLKWFRYYYIKITFNGTNKSKKYKIKQTMTEFRYQFNELDF